MPTAGIYLSILDDYYGILELREQLQARQRQQVEARRPGSLAAGGATPAAASSAEAQAASEVQLAAWRQRAHELVGSPYADVC